MYYNDPNNKKIGPWRRELIWYCNKRNRLTRYHKCFYYSIEMTQFFLVSKNHIATNKKGI